MRKMKKLVFLLMLFNVATLSLWAQKKDKIKGNRIVSKIINEIPSFKTINLDENFQIELLYSSSPEVIIETDENLHDIIEIVVNDSVLSFNFLKKITSKKKLHIQVNYTDALTKLVAQDNSTINVISTIKASNFHIIANGSSKITSNLNTNEFVLEGKDRSKIKLDLNSKIVNLKLQNNSKLDAVINNDSTYVNLQQRSNASIDGNTESISVTTDNYASFMGKNYTAKSVYATANIASTITSEVLEDITIDASGNSAINIYGNPEITVKHLLDTSKIQKKVR